MTSPGAASAFNWQVPGISIPVPPSRNPLPAQPEPWDNLKFTPTGQYDVRRHLGVVLDEFGRFNRSRPRFLASDLAWLAAGASEDGHHTPASDKFSPEWHDLWNSLPTGTTGSDARKQFINHVRQLLFDLATLYDRITGGTTLLMHCSGTTIPNAPLVPEHLKAQVYLPPRFIAEHPEEHATIAFLVQTFIEHVGVPTSRDWRARASQIWSMNQSRHISPAVLPTALIPDRASHRGTLYIFRGRPWGSLRMEVSPSVATAPSASHTSNDEDDIYDIDDITYNEDALALITAFERAENLEQENSGLRDALRAANNLQEEMKSDFQARERVLEAEMEIMVKTVTRLERELSTTRVSFSPRSPSSRTPTTPLRSQPAYLRIWDEPRLHALHRPAPLAYAHHALMHLVESVDLIRRLSSVFAWPQEISKLSGVQAEAVDGLLEAMDSDRLAGAGGV
ncbi:hypothetical protein C8F04DRAFT_1253353 [Mycena alexandri]|uniref:Uncharacterized protein n=1 Tax=Mycena alexandri TaxID=1745969 RepID=A0AAD6XDI2_9AGAR|nr:hypothetical protein C8F04DRAFT_1253353 [Mycena alexandri]